MASPYQTQFSEWCWTNEHRSFTLNLVKMFSTCNQRDSDVIIRDMMSELFRTYKSNSNDRASNAAVSLDESVLSLTMDWNLQDLFNHVRDRLPQFNAVLQDYRPEEGDEEEEEEELLHPRGSSDDEVGTKTPPRRGTKVGDGRPADAQVSDLMAKLESLCDANETLTAENENIRKAKEAEIAQLNQKIEENFKEFVKYSSQVLELRGELDKTGQHNVLMRDKLGEAQATLVTYKNENEQLKETLRLLKAEHHKTVQAHELELARKDAEHAVELKKQLDAPKKGSSPAVRPVGWKSPSRRPVTTPVAHSHPASRRALEGALEQETYHGVEITVTEDLLGKPTPLEVALNDAPAAKEPAAKEPTVEELDSASKSPAGGGGSRSSSTSEGELAATKQTVLVVEEKGDNNSAASGKSDARYDLEKLTEEFETKWKALETKLPLLNSLLGVGVSRKPDAEAALEDYIGGAFKQLGWPEHDTPQRACEELARHMFTISNCDKELKPLMPAKGWKNIKADIENEGHEMRYSWRLAQALMLRYANMYISKENLLNTSTAVGLFCDRLKKGEELANVIVTCAAHDPGHMTTLTDHFPTNEDTTQGLHTILHGTTRNDVTNMQVYKIRTADKCLDNSINEALQKK